VRVACCALLAIGLAACGTAAEPASSSGPGSGGQAGGDAAGGADTVVETHPEDGKPATDAPGPSTRTLHVLWTVHVEGDNQDLSASQPECAQPLYQTHVGPFLSFACDVAGLEGLEREAEKHSDSAGAHPRAHISPAGEYFETEIDPTYGGKTFRTFDWLALGHEIGIQGHKIQFSGTKYCWPEREATPAGIERKLFELHSFAERWFHQGRKVNHGLTYSPGVKLEAPVFGGDWAAAEAHLDRIAYGLGYRVAFEDYDGCVKDSPTGGKSVPTHLYRADHGDGVQMYKVAFRSAPTTDCDDAPGARCESVAAALARLDEALAAAKTDPDPAHLHYFAFATHAQTFCPPVAPDAKGEVAGTRALFEKLDALVAAGERIAYVTPRDLLAKSILQTADKGPVYFLVSHNEPRDDIESAQLPVLRDLLSRADGYGMKLTLMFGAPWAQVMRSDPQRSAELDGWRRRGHEIAGHHHAVGHPGTWDGYSRLPEAEALAVRAKIHSPPEPFLGTLDDLMAQFRKLDPFVRSGCMNEESDWLEMPRGILYGTCSGYANRGQPGAKLQDADPAKALNEFASRSMVAGLERRWLAHAQVMKPESAMSAAQTYDQSAPARVLGFVVHPAASQALHLAQLMDHIHARDPKGERSMTLADIVRLGLLPDKDIGAPSLDGGP
jgi:hypothetical protein